MKPVSLAALGTVVLLVVTSCASFSALDEEVGSPKQTNSEDRPPVYGIVRSSLGSQWVYVDTHLNLGDQVHVKREALDGGRVRFRVDNVHRGIGETVTIDLARVDEHRVRADASVEWSHDYGPPFKGLWADVTGEVWVSSVDAASTPLVVHFELRGRAEGKATSIHGEVRLAD